MKTQIKILLSLLFFAGNAFAQQDSVLGNNRIHGAVKTPTGEVISGATFLVQRDDTTRQFAADVNGEIVFGLLPGDYQITASSIYGSEFKMFLKIVENSVNPDDIEFILDPAKYCCHDAVGNPYSKPISLPKPPYPPAARAVRARGEVVVAVKIGTDGKVISAIADGGHPLLRPTAVATALGSRFEESDKEAREAKLTYVFLGNEDARPGLNRYKNTYRINVIAISEVITTVNSDPGPRRSLVSRFKRIFSR